MSPCAWAELCWSQCGALEKKSTLILVSTPSSCHPSSAGLGRIRGKGGGSLEMEQFSSCAVTRGDARGDPHSWDGFLASVASPHTWVKQKSLKWNLGINSAVI